MQGQGGLGDIIRVKLQNESSTPPAEFWTNIEFGQFVNGKVAVQPGTTGTILRRTSDTERVFYFVPEITSEDLDAIREGKGAEAEGGSWNGQLSAGRCPTKCNCVD